jgi:hypothetical protein
MMTAGAQVLTRFDDGLGAKLSVAPRHRRPPR